MAELTFTDRVDDAILCAAFRLSRSRGRTLRGGLADVRASCVQNLEDDTLWGLRRDRCDALLFREDAELRTMALTALERER